jgi:hypothetical protein
MSEEHRASWRKWTAVQTAALGFVGLGAGEAVKAGEATRSPEGGLMNLFKGPQRETSQSGIKIPNQTLKTLLR